MAFLKPVLTEVLRMRQRLPLFFSFELLALLVARRLYNCRTHTPPDSRRRLDLCRQKIDYAKDHRQKSRNQINLKCISAHIKDLMLANHNIKYHIYT